MGSPLCLGLAKTFVGNIANESFLSEEIVSEPVVSSERVKEKKILLWRNAILS